MISWSKDLGTSGLADFTEVRWHREGGICDLWEVSSGAVTKARLRTRMCDRYESRKAMKFIGEIAYRNFINLVSILSKVLVKLNSLRTNAHAHKHIYLEVGQ